VQALKTLGPDRITPKTISKLQEFIGEDRRAQVLKDTKSATGWVRDTILKVCEEQV
jgi:hypothetical protein